MVRRRSGTECLRVITMRPCGALQACALIALACCSHAYYLPGTYPQEFTMGQNLQGEGSSDAFRIVPMAILNMS